MVGVFPFDPVFNILHFMMRLGLNQTNRLVQVTEARLSYSCAGTLRLATARIGIERAVIWGSR